ncbi:MAG: GTPase HflX [Eubacteriales bacterium]|nr:GTPase HflX [Eubacteriales bacterium]
MIENYTENKTAIIVGVKTDKTAYNFDKRMDELENLCEALSIECKGRVVQNLAQAESATYIGSGKLLEIKELIYEEEADTVIFLNTLTPSQLANITDILEAEVMDKTQLILKIFGERARTAEAKIQVEYASLEYMLPRLVGLRKNLSRQGGTGGSMSNKGSGEKQIELDRRHIEKRMADLRKELKAIEATRDTMRKKRQQSGIPLVSLAGYTNAGKSTLMNTLLSKYGSEEEKKVLEKDMLFATLDTTIRKICPGDNKDYLLADTVGFIEDLPHDLISAFRSTLGEIKLSDLILNVIDYSDDNYQEHIRVTEDTLKELKASHIPVIYVMNKADRLMDESELPLIRGNRIYISAKKGLGIDELNELIRNEIYGSYVTVEFLIPYDKGNVENVLRRETSIIENEYRENGTYIKCSISPVLYKKFKEYEI